MSRMKTFPRPTESNDQEQKSGHRGCLLLMLALYSNPKWLSVVRGTVERLTETLGFPAVQVRSSLARSMKHSLTSCGIPTAIGPTSPSPCIFERRSAVTTEQSNRDSKYCFVTKVLQST